LTYCYGGEVVAADGAEHVFCQVVDCLIHGIMLDVKPFVGSRTSTLDGIIPDLFRCADHVWTIV